MRALCAVLQRSDNLPQLPTDLDAARFFCA